MGGLFYNYLTITTDASHDGFTGIGAYAFIITCKEGRFKSSAVFKKRLRNSSTAEALCVCNALHYLSKLSLQEDYQFIVVNSDCQAVVNTINSPHLVKSKWYRDQIELAITKVCTKYNVRREDLYSKHVKAHTNNKEARSKANQWCDDTARDLMRKERSTFHQLSKESPQVIKQKYPYFSEIE